MIALPTLAADAGVAAKANAENATANTVAILPTVYRLSPRCTFDSDAAVFRSVGKRAANLTRERVA
jgi:hypothetical protein